MYYDRKARAQPLKVNEIVFLLDPKYDSQRSKEEFKTIHWGRTVQGDESAIR